MIKKISNCHGKCHWQRDKKCVKNGVKKLYLRFDLLQPLSKERYKMGVNSKEVRKQMNSNMSGRPGKNRRFFVGIVSVLWGKRFLIFIGTVSIIFLVSNFKFIGTEGKMWGKKSITNRYSWQWRGKWKGYFKGYKVSCG